MKKQVIINLTLVMTMLEQTIDDQSDVGGCEVEYACLNPTAAFFDVETCADESCVIYESESSIPLEWRDSQSMFLNCYGI